jgi:hypothetical protein
MKQFYVDTQGNKLIQDAITTAAEIAGIRVSEFLREEEYRQIILRFLDGKPDLTANHRIEPGWGEQYTIDQALQYFRELKEERKKPKFKVGDWVVSTIQFATTENRGAFQIESIPSESDIRLDTPFPSGSFQPKWLRKATPEEISAAQKIFIGGYEMKFLDNYIEVDKRIFTHHRVFCIADTMKTNDIKALIFHDCSGKEIKVDFETVKKITERLK